MTNEKKKAGFKDLDFDTVRKEIDKKYGEGVISYASNAKALNISRIPTGSFALDVEIGGGIPENRITTIVGPYESGKTTIALKIARAAQEKYPEKDVVWMDAEGAMDLEWVKKQGLNLEKLVIIRPNYAEQAFDIAINMVRVPSVSLIVVDSLTSLVPAREAEESMEDWSIGLNAYLNSKFLRKITSALWTGKTLKEDINNKCTILLLNQLRSKVAGYGAGKDIVPGGRALDFYSMLRIDLLPGEWKTETVRGREEVVGREIKFKTEKNRTFPAKRKGNFDLYTQDTGNLKAGSIDRVKEVLTYGIIWDVIIRKGAWFYLNDDQKFHGTGDLLAYLEDNQGIVEKIEQEILERVKDDYENKDVEVDPEGNILET